MSAEAARKGRKNTASGENQVGLIVEGGGCYDSRYIPVAEADLELRAGFLLHGIDHVPGVAFEEDIEVAVEVALFGGGRRGWDGMQQTNRGAAFGSEVSGL